MKDEVTTKNILICKICNKNAEILYNEVCGICYADFKEPSCDFCKDTYKGLFGSCTECCMHNEFDHNICLDCGKEFDVHPRYDEDYGKDR